jgi:hypothetical protein
VTVPFDDLIKDEREGVRTIRVTMGGKRIEVEVVELRNGVESQEDRAKRAKEEERLGGIKTIIYDQRTTMRDNITQNIGGGNFYAPVAAVMKDAAYSGQ